MEILVKLPTEEKAAPLKRNPMGRGSFKTKPAAGKHTIAWVGAMVALTWGGSAVGQKPLWTDTVGANGKITESWGRKAILGENFRPATAQRSITVYVLDVGVGKHQALQKAMPSGESWQKPTASQTGVGCYPHATHVAGVIGADGGQNTPPGVVSGVLPNGGKGVTIVSVGFANRARDIGTFPRECDQTSAGVYQTQAMDKIKELIQREGKVGIVSISSNPNSQADNQTLAAKIKELATPFGKYPGAFVVQSAGNYYKDACNWAFDPKVYRDGMDPNKDGVMVVGALKQDGRPVALRADGSGEFRDSTPFPSLNSNTTFVGSNFGSCVEVWAPGYHISSTWGGGKSTDNQRAGTTYGYNDFEILSGTSLSAPYVAGLAAYLAVTSDRLLNTPGEIEQAVRAYVAPVKDASGQMVRYADPANRNIVYEVNMASLAHKPALSKPTCSSIIPQVSTIPQQGGYFTARADCKGEPTSYTWTVNGVVQPGKGSSIGEQFPPNNSAMVLPLNIVVTASNSAGTSEPVRITVNQAAKTVVRPTCSSIIPQVSTIPQQGGYFTARADCKGEPTSYTWTVNGVVQPDKGSSIGAHFPPNNSATVLPLTIVVTASNSAGTSSPVQTTVVQQR